MKHKIPRRETMNTIYDYFRDTHKFRQQLLRRRLTITTILEYFPRFRDMPDLINTEYDLLWPEGAKNVLMKRHHSYATKIIKVARSHYDPTMKFLVEKFQNGDTDLCALTLVATLLPSTNYVINGRSTATSRVGSLSSFIQIRPNGIDVDAFAKSKEEVQPSLLCLGRETHPTEFFLICDRIAIAARATIIQAFDRLFKSFFVFNVEYPLQLLPFYNFFVKVVYRNKYPCRVLSQVRALSSQLGVAGDSEP